MLYPRATREFAIIDGGMMICRRGYWFQFNWIGVRLLVVPHKKVNFKLWRETSQGAKKRNDRQNQMSLKSWWLLIAPCPLLLAPHHALCWCSPCTSFCCSCSLAPAVVPANSIKSPLTTLWSLASMLHHAAAEQHSWCAPPGMREEGGMLRRKVTMMEQQQQQQQQQQEEEE